ncbi:hypothetical protein FQN60_007610 [Etheostoma spectabile]|uniref:Uncharacterized protein n=1 Tax=Etheostoma spectabile TaxID=54343 RepID=A0A5J5D3C8_9PERO|nr:hypothetical protein FQN60_007610 [Etheostoma spectabile]
MARMTLRSVVQGVDGTWRLRWEECGCLPQLSDEVTLGKGSGMHSTGRRKCEPSSGAKSGQDQSSNAEVCLHSVP